MDELRKRFDQVKISTDSPEDHHQRFLKKLAFHESKTRRTFSNKTIITAWSAAAAIIVLALIVFTKSKIDEENINSARIEIRELAPEAGRVQDRLADQVLQKTKNINLEAPFLSEDLKRLKLLELEYKKLDSMLQHQVINERVIRAMIENYGHRLRILEAMNQKIKALDAQQKQTKILKNDQV